ncbi:mechanosensitive ion channel [candidate division KSB1 bacterium]|nr:mechanosensitive ion channel [candidate division KSB1 bacterium]
MESLGIFFSKTFFNNTIQQYLLFFGVIIVAIILGRVVYYFFKNYVRKLTAKSSTKIDDYLIDIIEEPIVLLIVSIGVWLGAMFLSLSAAGEKFFENVVVTLLTLTVAWFFVRFFDMLVTVYVAPMVKESESKLDDQVLPIIRKSIKIVIILLALIIALANLGYDILSVLAGLGIGGLAIALAAQDAVKNIIGGLTIFWDKPFQLNDWIEVSGKSGSVLEVGLRSTRIKTIGGTHLVIPNSTVVDTMVENYSPRTKRRQVVNIGLVYSITADEMEKAFNIIENTIKSIAGTDPDDIMIRFTNFGAYSLDLEIVYWIVDNDNWKMIIHQVNMGIKRNLDDAGIEMAFPTETHYVINQNN